MVYNYSVIKKIISSIENQPISVSQWLVGFTGIVFIRFMLETLSSPSFSGFIPSDAPTLIHYFISFLTILLGLICIVRYFVKGNGNLAKIALFGLPIIWLGPIIDLILSYGKGYPITYIFDGSRKLLLDFISFFGPQVSIGLRIELLVIIFSIGLYVWSIRKNKINTILAVLSSYIFLFFIFSLPSIIYILNHGYGNVMQFLSAIISESNIAYNTIDATLFYGSSVRAFELGFDKLLSQISFILSFIFISIWFWQTKKEKLFSIIKNSRPERVALYLTLLALGMGYSFMIGNGKINSWIDWLGIITLALSWYGAWMFAVHTNDVADIAIDEVSNPNRPITGKVLAEQDMSQGAYIWLLISFVGAWSAGYYPFFMNLVFTAAYYIYSVPPLRLKRIPVLSSFLISVACLSTVMAGFFFLSADKTFRIFSPLVAIGILVIFTLATNIRDIKDIDGDRKEGIKTLPVIFGKNGKKLVGMFFAVSFLLTPIFFSFYTLYIVAIPIAIIGYKSAIKDSYDEKIIFRLYFAFVALSVILIGSLSWLANFI